MPVFEETHGGRHAVRRPRGTFFGATAVAVLLLLSSTTAFAQTTTVTAAWDRNTDATTAGYMVYYGTESGNYRWTHDAGNQTTAQLTLTRGSVYFVVVRGYNSTGQVGLPSNEVSINLVDAPAPTAQLQATLQNPTTAAVSWQTTNAVSATLNGASVAVNGSTTVTISATTTFTLVATGASGATVTRSATVTVTPRPTATLTASPSTIAPGGSSTLSWTTSGAASISINQGVGSVASSGSRAVTPAATTTYTLTATNAGGSTTATAVVTVSAPPSATSPDGTTVPPAARIVDSQGAVWTISGSTILRNGASAAGGSGSQILWTGGAVYVLGTDSNWWRWLGSAWSNVGRTPPGGVPTPPTPPSGPSADGTLVPPAARIVDSQGAVWTISGIAILRNGASAAGGSGSRILWTGGAVYVFGMDLNWWRWLGSTWSNVGRTQPGSVPAPPTPPSGPSADGTLLPPATQIVDNQGAVWTLSGTVILRNGASAAGGSGSKILWTGGSIYVLGTDSNWWRWVASSWSYVGRTQPGGVVSPPSPGTQSADGTLVPPAAQIVDAQGAVWTINGASIQRNGVTTGATGLKLLWLRGVVYVLGTDNWNWWRWTGYGWTFSGTTQPR